MTRQLSVRLLCSFATIAFMMVIFLSALAEVSDPEDCHRHDRGHPSALGMMTAEACPPRIAPTARPAGVRDAPHAHGADPTCVETYSLYLEGPYDRSLRLAFLQFRGKTEKDRTLFRWFFFIVANAVMMAGLFWWFVSGATWLLAPILLAETLAYFDAALAGAGVVGNHWVTA